MLDLDTLNWHAHARIDVFDTDSLAAAAKYHNIDWEPNQNELLTWARQDKGLWTPDGRLEPYPDERPLGDDLVMSDGNLLTRLGLARIGNLLISTATWVGLSTSRGRIGVGDGSTAAATTDTDLGAASGSTHRQFVNTGISLAQGSGANSGVTTLVATFGTTLANFTWNEWGIDGGAADGTTVQADAVGTPGLINHKVTTLLTKTSSVSAVFTVTITIS